AVCGTPERKVLNLVSTGNQASRLASVEVCREKPGKVKKVYDSIVNLSPNKKGHHSQQLSLFDDYIMNGDHVSQMTGPNLTMPASHPIPSPKYLDKILYKIYDKPPESYQQLLELRGVGPSTLRALTM